MANSIRTNKPHSDQSNISSRTYVCIALGIAIIAVSAWIVVPIGPVPVTLQMFAIPFLLVVFKPKEAAIAVLGYLLLGALGMPVFSRMQGGIGVFLGPTGGYLMGYGPGALLGAAALAAFKKGGLNNFATNALAGIIFTIVAYCGGWAWYSFSTGVAPIQAFLVTVAPFIVLDLLKVVAATACGRSVLRALPWMFKHNNPA